MWWAMVVSSLGSGGQPFCKVCSMSRRSRKARSRQASLSSWALPDMAPRRSGDRRAMPVSARVAFVLSDRRQISLSSGVCVSANAKVSGLCAAESDGSSEA